MPLDTRIAIAEWLECYSISPPTRPSSRRKWPEWERQLRDRDERLLRAALAMEGGDTSELDDERSFRKAMRFAQVQVIDQNVVDLDIIAGMLWVALGDPAPSKVAESGTRLVNTTELELQKTADNGQR